jgi:predicted PhzF superfamily epimerase YddE/YHI9
VTVPLFQVDAFTERPFAGNPAAVCVLESEEESAWLQAIAAELRMPATAFVVPAEGEWRLRWFTAETELELCGHGTLAAAHVLWETGMGDPGTAVSFQTPAGEIRAAREDGSIFVALGAGRVAEAAPAPGLVEALGGRDVVSVWRTPLDYLVLLESPAAVIEATPAIDALSAIDARGVIVTSAGGEGVDFTSRFFAPSVGIREDSVTGSAHASLGPFWAERLGKTSLRARQASARGGYVDLRVEPDVVHVGGPAVTVSRGILVV